MKKRQLLSFLPYDQVGMEQHLAKMARKGWRLSSISSFWTYEKAEPAELQYCVTYCPKASYYDPKPSDEQETFYDYCQDAGWDLVCESGVFQIFVANRLDPTPMDTDPQQKLDTACAAMKKIYGPAHLLLIAVSAMQIAIQISNLRSDPLAFFSDYFGLSMLLAWILIPASLLISYVSFRRWKKACQVSLDCGDDYLDGHDRFRWLTRLFMGCSLGAILISFAGLFSLDFPAALFGLIPVFVMIVGIRLLSKGMKKWGCKASTHLIAVILMCILAVPAMLALLTHLIFSDVISAERTTTRIYTYPDSDITVGLWNDDLPLYVEDLYDVAFENYSYELFQSSSLFLTSLTGTQDSFGTLESDADYVPDMEYTVLTPHFDWMYDIALDSLMTQFHYDWMEDWEYRSFFPIDATDWGTETAYQLQDEDGDWRQDFILEQDGVLVYIHLLGFPDEVSKQQMNTIVEALF
ncbi:DUF2812 domain-containing protein [Bengtsoniella intestinalis]|uniref:DUF2812 domain-containing protein n=1 Tax=Bengtsoniella intestinalis TaxID=3073143 RepID=UPI00391EF38A